jgi:hypothetical protein
MRPKPHVAGELLSSVECWPVVGAFTGVLYSINIASRCLFTVYVNIVETLNLGVDVAVATPHF